MGLSLWGRFASRCKQIFCLHRRKKHYGTETWADQEGGEYRLANCARCGKYLGVQYEGDDGMGHVFM